MGAFLSILQQPSFLVCVCAYVFASSETCHTHEHVMSPTYTGHVTHMNEHMSLLVVRQTHSCVWRDPYMWVTWRVHVCDMTQVVDMCDMSASCVYPHTFICLWQVPFVCVTWRIHLCAMTHMRWLPLVGSFKLYVSFANEPYKKDDILQKRSMILRSLLIVATP